MQKNEPQKIKQRIIKTKKFGVSLLTESKRIQF